MCSFLEARSLVVRVVLVLAVIISTQPASWACVRDPPQPPVCRIIFISPTEIWACFEGYQTFGSAAGMNCACAFNVNGLLCIDNVLEVKVMISGTGQPLPGFGPWTASATVGDEFNTLSGDPSADFRGFETTTSAVIPDNISLDIYVRLQLAGPPLCNYADLAAELLSSDALLGTGEVDSGGFLIGHETIQIAQGVVPDGPWSGLGNALAGTSGFPRMLGEGPLTDDSPLYLMLRDALPTAPTGLVVGLFEGNLPFKGGTLVPFPTILIDGLNTGRMGSITLAAGWPAGLPPGVPVTYQWLIADAGAVSNIALSNALRSTTQALPPALVVAGVSPLTAAEGTVLTIVGSGFGWNPLDLCISIDDVVPVLPISVTPTQIIAVVPPVAQTVNGPVMVALGHGTSVPPVPQNECDVSEMYDGRTWSSIPDTNASAGGQSISVTVTSTDTSSFTYDSPDEQLEWLPPRSWSNSDEVEINLHVYLEKSGSIVTCDIFRRFTLETTGTPSTSLCLSCITAVIEDAWSASCADRISVFVSGPSGPLIIQGDNGWTVIDNASGNSHGQVTVTSAGG